MVSMMYDLKDGIELNIICVVRMRGPYKFSLKYEIGRPSWLRLPLIPNLEASQCNSKGLEKSRRTKIDAEIKWILLSSKVVEA